MDMIEKYLLIYRYIAHGLIARDDEIHRMNECPQLGDVNAENPTNPFSDDTTASDTTPGDSGTVEPHCNESQGTQFFFCDWWTSAIANI